MEGKSFEEWLNGGSEAVVLRPWVWEAKGKWRSALEMLTQDGKGPYEPSLRISVSLGLPGEALESAQARLSVSGWGKKKPLSAGALSDGAEMARRWTPAALLREIFFHLSGTRSVSEVNFKTTFSSSG